MLLLLLQGKIYTAPYNVPLLCTYDTGARVDRPPNTPTCASVSSSSTWGGRFGALCGPLERSVGLANMKTEHVHVNLCTVYYTLGTKCSSGRMGFIFAALYTFCAYPLPPLPHPVPAKIVPSSFKFTARGIPDELISPTCMLLLYKIRMIDVRVNITYVRT